MSCTTIPMSRSFALVGSRIGLAILMVAGTPAAVNGQTRSGCMERWTRPVACTIRLSFESGRGWHDVRPGGKIRIGAGDRIVLHATALDQNGWRFPEERLLIGLDIDPNCGDALLAHRLPSGDWSIEAGARHGRCRAVAWVPGNLNLDTKVMFEILPRAAAGYTRTQARFIARALYRAILARKPDASGLEAATAEIQRGRLKSQVKSMFESSEFRRRRGRLSAAELLDSIYRGLLGRAPDSRGVRTYLHEIERGRETAVVLRIIRSEEFESRLLRRPTRMRRRGM